MKCNARRHIHRLVGLTVAILFICGSNTFALQEKLSPLSDYQYKKDLPQYEAIKKETDAQKKADALLGFIKERPISRLLLYAANDYMESVKPLIAKNDSAKAISMIEALLAVLPTEKTVADEQIPVGADEFLAQHLKPTQAMLQQALLQVYYQANNMPKAAEAAEKLYAMNPNKALLPALADIYLKMQNLDKYLEIGQKMLTEFPMEEPQGYDTAIKMAQVYIQKQDVASATGLLTKVMDVYGDKVPPNVQEPQWNATRAFAYGVLASGIYATKDYAKAQGLYEKVAKFDPKREDAYYYIGMCKWQSKDPEGAIDSFAKCVVLNGQLAARAKQYLEDLYKARHNNTLDGIEEVMAKAKTELGM
jgi:tetratricopeptide (TPR) repeat protein